MKEAAARLEALTKAMLALAGNILPLVFLLRADLESSRINTESKKGNDFLKICICMAKPYRAGQ